jgi:hypothetical protein
MKERKKKKSLKNFIKAIDERLFFNLLKKINISFNYYKLHSNYEKNYFLNHSYYNYNNNSLTELCEKYKSDKGSINHKKKGIWPWQTHTYSNYYYSLFNHFKDDVKLVFECGLGTNNPNLPGNMTANGVPGASLKVWRDYFKNAQIYGADIDKDILFEEDRIKTFYVDQLNTPSIKAMWGKIGIRNFDIIIDDGLHTTDANINLFLNSFKKLKKNGIYIIEDVKSEEFSNIMEKLKNFSPELVILGKNNLYSMGDNNLIIIRNI